MPNAVPYDVSGADGFDDHLLVLSERLADVLGVVGDESAGGTQPEPVRKGELVRLVFCLPDSCRVSHPACLETEDAADEGGTCFVKAEMHQALVHAFGRGWRSE